MAVRATRGVLCYASPRLRIYYDMSRRGIGDIARSDPVRRAVHDVGEKAKAYAVSISPERSGEYKASFHVIDSIAVIGPSREGGGLGMARCITRLWNTSPHSKLVEYGNRRGWKGARVLTKTLFHLNGLDWHVVRGER